MTITAVKFFDVILNKGTFSKLSTCICRYLKGKQSTNLHLLNLYYYISTVCPLQYRPNIKLIQKFSYEKKLWNFNLNFEMAVGKLCFTLFFESSPSSQVWLVCKICSTLLNLATGHWKSVLSANTIWSDLSSLPFYESWASCLERSQWGQILFKKATFESSAEVI